MSTAGRKPRAAKPKATKEVAAPAPVAVAAPAPVAAAAVVPVAAPAPVEAAPVAAPAAPKVQKPRPAIISSSSRVRTNINAKGINSAVYALSDPIDEKLKAYKSAKESLESGKKNDTREVEKTVDGKVIKTTATYERAITPAEAAEMKKLVDELQPNVAAYERDSYAYSQVAMRFAKHAPDAVAVTCDRIVETILETTIKSATTGEKIHKNVGMNEMYGADLESTSLAPLYNRLPLYISTRDRITAAKRALHEKTKLAVELKENEKKWQKRFKITKKMIEATKAEAPAAPAEAAPVEAAPAAVHEHVGKATDLTSHVEKIGKWVVRTKFPDSGVRLSKEMCDHISQLLREFLQRFHPMLARAVRAANSKTVKVSTVEYVLESLLVDGHKPLETITLVDVDILDPDQLKAEEAKKAAEKAAGRKYVIDKSKIRKVAGKEARHTITYPTSGFAELKAAIAAALAAQEAEDKAAKEAK